MTRRLNANRGRLARANDSVDQAGERRGRTRILRNDQRKILRGEPAEETMVAAVAARRRWPIPVVAMRAKSRRVAKNRLEVGDDGGVRRLRRRRGRIVRGRKHELEGERNGDDDPGEPRMVRQGGGRRAACAASLLASEAHVDLARSPLWPKQRRGYWQPSRNNLVRGALLPRPSTPRDLDIPDTVFGRYVSNGPPVGHESNESEHPHLARLSRRPTGGDRAVRSRCWRQWNRRSTPNPVVPVPVP